MYIIQTNTSIGNGKPVDFQSLMYQTNKTWDEFKEYILNDNAEIEQIQKGTMIGNMKTKDNKVDEILINDDFHLEVIYKNDRLKWVVNAKYYGVADEIFTRLINNKKLF